MTDSHNMDHRLAISLADLGRGNLAVAGGKGANLGELVRQRFPVPPGWVLTTHAFDALMRSGVGDRIAHLLQTRADPGRLREAIVTSDVPAAVVDELARVHRELDARALAVRSSATAEDLPGATFAGQQDTELNVVGLDAMIDAVRRCWASLYTDRAVAYRRERSIDPASVRMAVVIQAMVAADAAGVMFSADPVTGRRDAVIIDANPGLGEAVVAGRVTPEHYVIDDRGRLAQWSRGGREVVIVAAPGGGVRDRAGQAGEVPLLTRPQQVSLADLARRAATAFGSPQDLEWAIADGEVFVLQSRPLTALPPEPLRLDAIQRRIGPFYLEMFATRPYPIDVTAWFGPAVVPMLRGMAGSVGVAFPSVGQLLTERDGVVVAMKPPRPRLTRRVLRAPFSLAHRIRRYRVTEWPADARVTAHAAEIDRLNRTDPEALDWAHVLGLIDDAIEATVLVAELRTDYLPAAFVPQLPLRVLLLLLGRPRLAASLLAGAPTRTRQANDALEELARVVRTDPRLTQAFANAEPDEILHRLDEPASAGFRLGFEAFLREYGHRETVSVVLVTAPTWSAAPEVVLGIVKVLAADPPRQHEPGEAAERELLARPLLRIPVVRRRVFRLVDAVRRGTAFREDSHFLLTGSLPPLRRALLELGRRLTAARVVDDPEDVFHLRLHELRTVHDGEDLTAAQRDRLRATVARRKEMRTQLAATPLAAFASRGRAPAMPADALLTGTGASGGRASGRVRVIRGPEEFGRLRSGEVLVCPYTNPAWTPLFPRAAAIIVDTGGVASHAAIVAREYGIPAVMGTRTGTTTLVDGQEVTVDGTAGWVVRAGGVG